MKKILLFPLLISFLIFPSAFPNANVISNGLQEISLELSNSLEGEEVRTVAVAPFQGADGACSEFGFFVADEIVLSLVTERSAGIRVIERSQLKKLLDEIGLSFRGLIEEDAILELGKIHSVDAIVLGQVAQVGSKVRVNARLIATESGEIFSAAAKWFERSDIGSDFLADSEECQLEESRKFDQNKIPFRHETIPIPFVISASDYDVGEIPASFSDSVVVKQDSSGRFFTAKEETGNIIVRNLNLVDNFTIRFTLDFSNFTQDIELSFANEIETLKFRVDEHTIRNHDNYIIFRNKKKLFQDTAWRGGEDLNEVEFQMKNQSLIVKINDKVFHSKVIQVGAVLYDVRITDMSGNDRVFKIEILK